MSMCSTSSCSERVYPISTEHLFEAHGSGTDVFCIRQKVCGLRKIPHRGFTSKTYTSNAINIQTRRLVCCGRGTRPRVIENDIATRMKENMCFFNIRLLVARRAYFFFFIDFLIGPWIRFDCCPVCVLYDCDDDTQLFIRVQCFLRISITLCARFTTHQD